MRQLASLDRSDRAVLVRAAFWLLLVDVGLRLLGFSRLQVFLSPRRTGHGVVSAENGALSLDAIEHVCDLVALMGRHHLYPMSCLTRALALQRMLAGQGVRIPLRIGVRRENKGLRAHAWLEYQGQPVGERDGVRVDFRPLLSPQVSRQQIGDWVESH